MDGENPYAGGTQIGQGWAQVFKPFESPYLDKYISRLEKQKEEESAATKGIIKELSALEKVDVLPGDVPRFAEKQNEIRNYVRENIDALRSGDIKATLDFQEKINQYGTLAANSKKYREEGYDFGKAMALASDKFSDEQRALHAEKMKSSFNEDGTPRVYNYADIEKVRPRWDPIKFWKQINDSYDPSSNTYKFQDKKTGLITTITESEFKDPKAIVKDMMMNPDYNEHVRTEVDKLEKENPEEYKKLVAEAEGDSRNFYDQYAVREFKAKMPGKTLDSKVYPTSMLEKPTRFVVNIGGDGKPKMAGGRTSSKGINWSVAETITPGKVKQTISFDPKDSPLEYDLLQQPEYKELNKNGLLKVEKIPGSQEVKSVTIYDPATTTEMPLLKDDGTNLAEMVLYDGKKSKYLIPTSIKYNKNQRKWQVVGYNKKQQRSETVDLTPTNQEILGINPEQELKDAGLTQWIPTAGKAAAQPSRTTVKQVEKKAPTGPPSKSNKKIYTVQEWNKLSLADRRKLQKEGASYK